MKVLVSITRRLVDNPCYKADYGPRTEVLNYFVPRPLDVADELSDEDLEKAADALLLQIREGSYETFVELPAPRATELTATCLHRSLAIRFVRMFDPQKLQFVTAFSIGVHA